MSQSDLIRLLISLRLHVVRFAQFGYTCFVNSSLATTGCMCVFLNVYSVFIKATNHHEHCTWSRTACVRFDLQNRMPCYVYLCVYGFWSFCFVARPIVHSFFSFFSCMNITSRVQGKYTMEMCIYKPNVFFSVSLPFGIIITSNEYELPVITLFYF